MAFTIEPAEFAAAITPDDSNALDKPTRSVYVGTAGDLRVMMWRGGDVTFVGVAGGTVLPIRVKQVFATSTDASDIVGLW